MSTCVPAFNPDATQSSSVFSNRFFSLTTAFRKSVLSMCGACPNVRRDRCRGERTAVTEECTTTYHIFIEKHLYHALDRIADVDEFEELQKRSDARRSFVLGRLVREHAFRRTGSPVKIRMRRME